MNREILFIQGGGDNGYGADKPLTSALMKALGKEYTLRYPELKSDETAPDFGWLKQIGKHIAEAESGVIIVAHSLGASMLLKYLSEHTLHKKIAGIFLLAVPFWEGKEDWKQGLKLRADFADTLPNKIPVFFYQCKDDDEVPFSHLDQYRKKLSKATFRVFDKGGHQFINGVQLIADDIKAL